MPPPSFSQFTADQRLALPLPSPAAIKGGTFVVTGANTGLGYECAKHLVALGAARVVIAVRSVSKGEAARETIERDTATKGVAEAWELDLASLDLVEAFARRMNSTLDRVDAVVHNASVAMTEFSTVGGLETTLMVNVLGTMLLVLRTMPLLRASAKKYNVQPRVAVVVSGAGFRMDGDVLNFGEGNLFETLSKPESMKDRYPLSKVIELFAVRQLAALAPVAETGVIIDAISPGVCGTSLDRNAPWFFRLFLFLLRLYLGRTAEQGSRTLLHAATVGPEAHGTYVADCQDREAYLPDWINGEGADATQKRIWDDILATLAAKGHKVDLASVLAKA